MKRIAARVRHLFLFVNVLPFACLSAWSSTAAPSPLKVFILAGQSNMEGHGVADLEGRDYNNGKGTLAQLLRDPAKAPLFRHLRNDQGHWAVRDDVTAGPHDVILTVRTESGQELFHTFTVKVVK